MNISIKRILENSIVYRNLVGWWIIGITTDFFAWMIVTSAHDLIDLYENQESKSGRMCNRDSEGLILTVDIFPSFIVCLVLPFLPLWINIRYLVMMILSVTGVVMIGMNASWGVTLGGIGLCSMFNGVTMSSLLNYIQVFKSSAVVKPESLIFAWSSGIGTSGILASGLYLVATENGVNIRTIFFSTLAVPVIMTMAFYLLISNPNDITTDICKEETKIDEINNKTNYSTIIKEIECSNLKRIKCTATNQDSIREDKMLSVLNEINREIDNQNKYNEQLNTNGENKNRTLSKQKDGDAILDVHWNIRKHSTDSVDSEKSLNLSQKLQVVLPIIFTYTLPYALGFLCQYTVNQGFFELMSFSSVMPVSSSVRWFQFVSMLSNFLFKSSGKWIKVDNLWTLVGLQLLILIVIAMQSVYAWMGDGYLAFWMVVILVFVEGALGALNYVNTYRRVNKERPEDNRGFSLSITVLGEPTGILTAAFVSVFIHKQICQLPPT